VTAPAVVVAASRRTGEGDNTLIDPPEVRRIVLAQGIQFTREDSLKLYNDAVARGDAYETWYYRSILFPEGLVDRLPGLFAWELDGHHHALYLNLAQNVIYQIDLVEDRAAFREALLTEGIAVIYNGHARFGRGPCFGPPGYLPGDDWENGGTPDTGGIFRMGYPFVGIPGHEIIKHGYHTRPLPATEPIPTREQCDPELRPHLGHLQARRVSEMHADPMLVEHLADLFGIAPDSDERFWTFLAVEDQEHGLEVHIVLYAGWENTATAPADLGATDFACRMFCHFGCSTFQHNYHILRTWKGWKREGDDRLAYWQTDLAKPVATNMFLSYLLACPKRQDWQPWGDWAAYAVHQTNRELIAGGHGWRII
jgi:hypothetical protein